jgi:GntR family transcriptional regulator
MQPSWNDNQPIYRQLRDQIVARILEQDLAEGEALPSVRNVAVDFQLNPITVSKAYQTLVDDHLVEKRRGLGMFVKEGARSQLMQSEREHFLNEEWPAILERIERMGLNAEALLGSTETEK